MAEPFYPKDQYNGSEYLRYKSHEKEALQTLFGNDDYKQWSVRDIYYAAKKAVPSLSKRDHDILVGHLEKSITARRNFALRFRFAPKRSQKQHAHWTHMIERICKLAQLKITDVAAHNLHQQEKLALRNEHEHSEQCHSGHPMAEQEQFKVLEDSTISADQAIFLRFLEEIELCVAEAEALWGRVALTELDPSTAAILTNTYVCTISSMITAETFLNPSWFKHDCVTESLSGLDSTYWAELKDCVRNIKEISSNMVLPDFEPAMLLTQLLEISKTHRRRKTIFDTPLVSAVAASLVCRVRKLTTSTNSQFLQQLKSSFIKQIHCIEPILQHQLDVYKDHNTFLDMLVKVRNVRKWAASCCDPVSLGHMMSRLRIDHVLCNRLFIYDSSILQLFAYIYERTRLREKNVNPALEELLGDQRIVGLLYLDGRPKDLQECEQGIKKWTDPEEALENLKRMQDIFRSRCKPTVAQQILDEKGRVTSKILKQLNSKALEDHLRWELDLPDPIHLEVIIIDAVNKIAKRKYSRGEAWIHLRHKILYQPKKEKELLSKFMEDFHTTSRKTYDAIL